MVVAVAGTVQAVVVDHLVVALAGDYLTMLQLVKAEVHLRPRLLIADPLAGPDSAELQVVPLGRCAG
jgi:hypothetical protein